MSVTLLYPKILSKDSQSTERWVVIWQVTTCPILWYLDLINDTYIKEMLARQFAQAVIKIDLSPWLEIEVGTKRLVVSLIGIIIFKRKYMSIPIELSLNILNMSLEKS